MNGSKKLVWLFVLALFLVVVGGGVLIYFFTTKTTADPEVMMGILVVVAIATLMAVLFIVAAGFSSMSLTDPKQALGLPEGSIRAMIALVLIMVFIIFGIHLFRKVAVSDKTYFGQVKQVADVKIPVGTKTSFMFERMSEKDKYEDEYEDNYDSTGKMIKKTKTGKKILINDNNFHVWGVAETSEEGKRLAQQLITTVGTLVVAIASFYFGTTMASSGAKKEREEVLAAQTVPVVSNPVIKDITPKEGEKGQEIPMMEIIGTDFKAPRMVQLLRGSEAMVCTGVLSNPTKIQCKVMIDKEPDGKWDVLVENEDGKQARLAEVFVIKHT
jgi:hypothetical protein